ncbi:MAG: DUF4388 domain-containing protein [Nitrospirota bacterium]|nr:MAG: DUF4388 domain-containing protein [Nitrospirota bacterium]
MSLIGRLEDLALSDIFQILSVGKKTGALLIRSDSGNAMVLFKDGLVVNAESDVLESDISQDLVSAGLLKDSMFPMIESVKKDLPDKPIAEIILEMGAINRDHLDKIGRKRIEQVVYNLLLWEDGEFQFELDELDVRDKIDLPDSGWEISKGMSPEYLLMEGARVYDETAHQSFTPDEDFFTDVSEGDEDWESPPAPVRKDLSALRALTQELRFPNSTSEITLLILRFASDMYQRGVLFMVGPEEMAGLGQFGLEIDRADEKIRETVLDVNKSPSLKEVIDNAQPYRGVLRKDEGTEFMIRVFGGKWPSEVALFPIIAEGRVVAFLYVDNLGSGDPFAESEGLEIFITQAGMALEKAILQRRLTEMNG